MTEYVAGFLFDRAAQTVTLIRKNRPEWQAGRLNGIGGHIEPGETPATAMRREFREEAGLDLDHWEHYATVQGDWGRVWFFRAAVDHTTLMSLRPQTDETIEHISTRYLPGDVIPNLHWLIPLAMYTNDAYEPLVAEERTA